VGGRNFSVLGPPTIPGLSREGSSIAATCPKRLEETEAGIAGARALGISIGRPGAEAMSGLVGWEALAAAWPVPGCDPIVHLAQHREGKGHAHGHESDSSGNTLMKVNATSVAIVMTDIGVFAVGQGYGVPYEATGELRLHRGVMPMGGAGPLAHAHAHAHAHARGDSKDRNKKEVAVFPVAKHASGGERV